MCNGHSAMCILQCAQCNVHIAMCIVQYSQCNVHNGVSIVQCAQYNVELSTNHDQMQTFLLAETRVVQYTNVSSCDYYKVEFYLLALSLLIYWGVTLLSPPPPTIILLQYNVHSAICIMLCAQCNLQCVQCHVNSAKHIIVQITQ